MSTAMEFWTCILCLCVAFFFLLKLKSKTGNTSKLPPGPKPLPVIGNLLDLGEKPHKSLAAMAEVHGPIMSLKLGRVTAVVVSSSTMAKEVLQTNDQFLCNRAIPDALKAHAHDEVGFPWISVSPLWRNYRKICNNTLFAGKILDANENLRRRKVEELVEIVRKSAAKGEAVDLGRLLFMTTLNLISNTVFSVDLADPNSELARKFKNYVWGILEEAGKPNLSDYFPALRKLDIQGARRRMKIQMGNVLDLIDSMINQRMKQQELNPDSVPNNDMLHHLLNNEDNDAKLDRNQIEHLLVVIPPPPHSILRSIMKLKVPLIRGFSNLCNKNKLGTVCGRLRYKFRDITVGNGGAIEESRETSKSSRGNQGSFGEEQTSGGSGHSEAAISAGSGEGSFPIASSGSIVATS